MYADRPADRSQLVRVHLEPMPGHDSHLQVPGSETIYVRRLYAATDAADAVNATDPADPVDVPDTGPAPAEGAIISPL
jgi:hypothetical protein